MTELAPGWSHHLPLPAGRVREMEAATCRLRSVCPKPLDGLGKRRRADTARLPPNGLGLRGNSLGR